MENRAIANEWFNIAKIDLDSAMYLCDMRPLPISFVITVSNLQKRC